MKQRITHDQLGELTPSQQEKLREWWQPKEYDIFMALRSFDSDSNNIIDVVGKYEDGCIYSYDEGWGEYNDLKVLPLLNIGQCIELLEGTKAKSVTEDEGFFDIITLSEAECDYIILNWDRGKYPELIDALFEAIKSIL